MRSKLVCKQWYSIIRNPDFAKNHSVHGASFRGIITTEFRFDWGTYFFYLRKKRKRERNRVSYLNVNSENKLEFNEYCTWDLTGFTGMTRLVKGLIGFYNVNVDSFSLCNISTQEKVKLPPSSLSHLCRYHLGYDPVNDVYKLLKLFRPLDKLKGLNAEIFSVGGDSDLTWRSIGGFPFCLDTQSTCINGTLYWSVFSSSSSLIAFDLCSESFQTIQLPPEHPTLPISADIAQIDGSVALISSGRFAPYKELWIMKCDAGGRFEGWTTRETIDLEEADNVLGCTLPTGVLWMIESYRKMSNVIEYDHVKKETITYKFVHDQPICLFDDPSINFARMQISYHEDNIMPLAPLFIKQQPTCRW